MTVPSVPDRSLERWERWLQPFLPFPLPMGGNVGNAPERIDVNRRVGLLRAFHFKTLPRLWPPDNRK